MEKKDKSLLWRLLGTVLLSLVLLGFYYFSLNFSFFPIVMIGYMVSLAALSLIYIIYNRAMSRNGVTEDMLPVEWDIEKKREFIEDGKRRLRRSRWILVAIISFIITFVVEALVLFVAPWFDGLF